MRRQTGCQMLLAAALGLTAQAAHSANITVDAGGACTLADAVTAANGNADTGGCVGSGAYGDDTITLQADVTLTAALPQITTVITIEGGGHFISGNNNPNVGSVLAVASSGNLTLNNAAVTGGRDTSSTGGGIDNYGTVTLNKVTVSGNAAASSNTAPSFGGGINNHGTLTLVNSTVSGNTASSLNPTASNGGGICNAASGMPPMMSGGTLTLINSTVSGNIAAYGAGIYNYGSAAVTLDKSAVSGNTASSIGGGICNGGTLALTASTVSGNSASNGGGIFNGSGTVELTNSTVSGNSAAESGGGVDNSDGTLTLTNSTVSGNTAVYYGAGIHNAGGWMSGNKLTLLSSVVSGNTGSGGNEICLFNTTVMADRHNLLGHSGETSAQAFSAAMSCDNFTPDATDRTAVSDGTHPAPLSSVLSSLADNGGPTKTHALPAGSPAVDLNPTCADASAFDQRGYSRPIGAGCDAGAFEAFVLPASTWLMTAPACTPEPDDITSQYGDDIPGGVYGTNWIAYKWDAAAQSYGSPQAGTDVLLQGTGNWLYSLNAATLTVTGTATPTEPCSNYGGGLSGNCFAVSLTPSTGAALWQMLGHTFPYSVSWADVRVATCGSNCGTPANWTQRTPTQAKDANIMAKEMWRWSGSTYEAKDDATSGLTGTLQPQEAVWVRMLPGSAGLTVRMLIPAR